MNGLKQVLLDRNTRPLLLQWFKIFCPHKGFITDKTYDESEMRTRQKNCMTPEDLWGVNNTDILEQKKITPVEPKMTKQKTKVCPARTNKNN